MLKQPKRSASKFHRRCSPAPTRRSNDPAARVHHAARRCDGMAACGNGAARWRDDLIPGRVDAMFSNLPGVISQHQNKTIRGIAVTSPKRSPAAPDIPAIAESIPGFDVSPWWGLFVQAKTPNELATRILADAVAALEHPSVRERYEAIGAPVTVSTPAALAARLASESEMSCPIIKAAGIKTE